MNKSLRPALASVILLILFSAAAMAASPAPSARDKCPVCGMFVAKFPNWLATARFRDGTTFYFDGPKDMFSYYFDVKRYTPGRNGADITAVTVREYYSLKTVDAKSAFYVTGSKVNGPMGRELVPLATEQDAASFMKDHAGKRILRFRDITPELLKALQ